MRLFQDMITRLLLITSAILSLQGLTLLLTSSVAHATCEVLTLEIEPSEFAVSSEPSSVFVTLMTFGRCEEMRLDLSLGEEHKSILVEEVEEERLHTVTYTAKIKPLGSYTRRSLNVGATLYTAQGTLASTTVSVTLEDESQIDHSELNADLLDLGLPFVELPPVSEDDQIEVLDHVHQRLVMTEL